MCLIPGGDDVPKEIPAPTKPPEPADVGGARRAEDLALYGGAPDLRTHRSNIPVGVAASGTGLK